ncbi:MAG: TonB-dependent receptor, partial [Bacteroidetes bacterium]
MGGPPGGPGSGTRRPEGAQQPATPAVTSAPKGSSTLKGAILDSLDATPVAYANILLYGMPEKKVLEGVLADGEGKFAFEKIAAGSYMLEISFPGYRTRKIENITLAKAQILDLGNVQLPLNITTLNEVTISSQQSIIEEKVDRLVYNAERDLTSKGGDASDVLRKVPMLSVDLDGNVSMRGSSNIRVLINNKPSTIMASSVADALKQIPADMIKTVEVITSPSAKYDAEGSGGIINIITKKTTLQGYSLNVDLGAGNRSANLGINGSYRQGKMGFTLGGFGRGFFNPSESQLTQSTLSAGKTLVTNQSIEAFDLGAFGSYNLGWDYELAKNQFLSAGLRYGMRNFSRDQSQNTNVFENTLLLTSNSREVDSRDISNNFDGNIDYLHTFKKPSQEWSMSSQFSRTNLTNNFDANNLNSLKEIINRQRNINLNTNQEITFQSDYQHPIGSNQMLEFGGKGIFRQVVSDYKYEIS